MPKIRIKDIAKAAGVSSGTVDRVIHKRGNVAKGVEKKINSAIDALGYTPNLAASALARKKESKIAIFIPTQKDDEFWESQINGIKRALRNTKDFGLSGDIFEYDEYKKGDLSKHIKTIEKGDYKAALLAPIHKKESSLLLNKCATLKLPFVQINTHIENENNCSLGYVGQDSFRSGELAAKLLDLTCKKDAPLAVLHMETDVEYSNHLLNKQNGFETYYSKNSGNLVITKRLGAVEKPKSRKKQIQKLLLDHPDIAGFFITTSRAHHIVNVLIDIGRTDINIVGFDLIPKNIHSLKKYKRLFLINQNPSLQGYYGVMRLFEFLIRNKKIHTSKYLPLDVITLENVSNYLHIEDRDSDELYN